MILLLIATFLFAYQAKVEPIEIYNISAKTNADVIFVQKEGSYINGTFLKQDSKQEEIDLKKIINQIAITKDKINLQKEIVAKKEEIYKRFKRLKTKSLEEKNLKFYDYANAKMQLLNLKNELNSLIATKEKLQDIIEKKSLKAKGYLYKLFVKKGEFAPAGKIVAQIADISKQKVTIYIPINQKIPNKIKIKNHIFTLYKKITIPDSTYITSYKVEYIGDGLKFGEIVTIKLKD